MEKIRFGSKDKVGIEFSKYDLKDPFDMVESMIDWLDDIDERDITKVICHIDHQYLNDDGKEFVHCFEMRRGVASNKGVSVKYYERMKRYRAWLLNHQMDVPEILERSINLNAELYEVKK